MLIVSRNEETERREQEQERLRAENEKLQALIEYIAACDYPEVFEEENDEQNL